MAGLEVRTLLSAMAPGQQKGDSGQPAVVDLHLDSHDLTTGEDTASVGIRSDKNGKEKISPVENISSGLLFVPASSGRPDVVKVGEPGRQVGFGVAQSEFSPPGRVVMAMVVPPGHVDVAGQTSPIHGKSEDSPGLQKKAMSNTPASLDDVPFGSQDHGPGGSANSPPGQDGKGASDANPRGGPTADVSRGQSSADQGISSLGKREAGNDNSPGQSVETRNEAAAPSGRPEDNPSTVRGVGPKDNAPLISTVGLNSSSDVETIAVNSDAAALSPRRDLADSPGRGMKASTESAQPDVVGASPSSGVRDGSLAASTAAPTGARTEAASATAAGQATPASAATPGLSLASVSERLNSIVSSVLSTGQIVATAAVKLGTAGHEPGRDVESDAGLVGTTNSHSLEGASPVIIDIQAVLRGLSETFAASLGAGEGQAATGGMPAQAQGARDGGFTPNTASGSRPVRGPNRPNQAAPDAPEDAARLALGAVNPQLVEPSEGTAFGEELPLVGPTISGALSESLGMNTALIDRALQGLLEEILGLDDSAARALGDEAMPLWLMGAGLAVAATIYARRRARSSRSAGLAGVRGPASNWIAGLSFDAV